MVTPPDAGQSSDDASPATPSLRRVVDAVRLGRLLDSQEWAVVTVRASGEIDGWNAAAERLFGRSDEAWIGRSLTDLGETAEDAAALADALARALAAEPNASSSNEISFDRPSLRERARRVIRWMFLRQGVAPDAPEGVVVFAREIGAMRRVEDELALAKHNEDVLNREFEAMLYCVSHDLRTPLLNVLGFAEELKLLCGELGVLLSDVAPDSKAYKKLQRLRTEQIPEAVGFIESSAHRMDGMLNSLLAISRLQRLKTVPAPIDMNRLLGDVRRECATRLPEGRISLEIGDLPPCTGDSLQLHQVFFQLLDNAVKAIPRDRPGVVRVTGVREPRRVIYCVEDDGIGIEPKHHRRIFEMFQKIDARRDEGEGLGLSIVQRVVNRHRGRVWVDSSLGAGSRFYIALPDEDARRA
ncbi:MAG TPA: ATP-binding protein [Pirellulales bacterium]